jgi:NodT family efflux transporter outer membrane factor (OMF) lipoprotein
LKRLRVPVAKSGALLCMLGGVAGCASLPPDVPAPGLAVPAAWSETDAPPVSLDLAQYWRLLGDPLLTEYVERSIGANRDLAQGLARVDQARAQLRQARAGYLPSVSASGGITRDIGDFSRDGVQVSAGVDADWEADLFGRIGADVAASEAELRAAGYSLADLQRLIVGQVALSTISARAAAEQLAIAHDTLAFQEDNLQIARWRVQAGLVSSLDVEQARAQRAQTAATIPALESSLASTANAISTLVGEPPGAVLVELTGEAPRPVPEPSALAGFAPPAEVLRRRPDVRAAEESLVASTERIGIARAQLLPLVRLTGSIGPGTATLGNLFDVVTGGLFAGISQLVFDGGRTRAQIEGAEAAARGALAAWEQSILFALEEVESAALAGRTADERVAINEEAVDAASNSVILARSQYQAGLTDFRDLLTSENQLLGARNQLVAAEADRASAFVRLTQALGGGWSEADLPLLAGNRIR